MSLIEFFSLLGSLARIAARALLIFRFPFDGYVSVKNWSHNTYAASRFGPRYKFRPWLLFDVEELQKIESIINDGSDEDLVAFRDSQVETFRLVSVVGALLAQAAISALSLPLLAETHYFARGQFTLSLVLSLLALFFTSIQQRELGLIRRPVDLRAWLSNGVRYTNADGNAAFQSSMVTHQLLQAPYELVSIAITLFIAGLGFYLGSAVTRDVKINVLMDRSVGNAGVLTAFLVGTVFGCALFGYIVGTKSAEKQRANGIENLVAKFQEGAVEERARNC